MTTSRMIITAAVFAAVLLPGCGRDEQNPSEPAVSREQAEYQAKIDEVVDENKRLMAAMAEAQKSGDPERIKAVAEAYARNRKKGADIVRDHVNLSSSKEKTK